MTTAPEQAAYYAMAEQAGYRPAAPSDELGNVTAPVDALNLETEAREYADSFHGTGNGRCPEFMIGYAGYDDRPALVWIIEAARNLAGTNHMMAAHLLRMASDDLIERMTLDITDGNDP